MTSPHFRPDFATRVGFVVTPSRTPHEAASRISSMFAVSRKIFTIQPRLCSRTARAVKNVSGMRAGNRPPKAAHRPAPSHRQEAPTDEDTADHEQEDSNPPGDGEGARRHLL